MDAAIRNFIFVLLALGVFVFARWLYTFPKYPAWQRVETKSGAFAMAIGIFFSILSQILHAGWIFFLGMFVSFIAYLVVRESIKPK